MFIGETQRHSNNVIFGSKNPKWGKSRQRRQSPLSPIKVDELSKQRDAFIKAEMEKKIAAGTGDSFDAKVAEMIQAQALRRGIRYDITAAGVSSAK